jgi:hypothetical protein
MEYVNTYVNTFDNQLSNLLNQYVKKPTIIRGVVHLLLILYVARLAPTLPNEVLVLFENQYFKLFIFALVLWTAQFSPSTSILIALAFMVTVNYSTNKALWEFLENVEEPAAEAPVMEAPVMEAPVMEAPVMEAPVMEAPVMEAPVVAAPVVAAVTEAPKAVAVVSEPAECYPVRRYDMSKVEPSEGQNTLGEFTK